MGREVIKVIRSNRRTISLEITLWFMNSVIDRR